MTHANTARRKTDFLFHLGLTLAQEWEGSNRLPIAAFRACGAGVGTSAPSLLTRPPPSPTAHGHLQRPGSPEKRQTFEEEDMLKRNIYKQTQKITRYAD